MVLGCGLESELGEDGPDVALDGLDLQAQPAGDSVVRPTLGHQAEDLRFAPRQLVKRRVVTRTAEQPRHDLWIDDGAPGGHASNGVSKIGDPHHVVLQQVPDAGGVLARRSTAYRVSTYCERTRMAVRDGVP